MITFIILCIAVFTGGGVAALFSLFETILTVFCELTVMCLEFALNLIKIPLNSYSIVKVITADIITITNIEFIDFLLLSFASLIPIIVLWIFSMRFLIKRSIKVTLSILIYICSIYLFSSLYFWIVLSIIVCIVIVTSVIERKNTEDIIT